MKKCFIKLNVTKLGHVAKLGRVAKLGQVVLKSERCIA